MKFRTGALEVPVFVTLALVPAAPVVVVPIVTVGPSVLGGMLRSVKL